MVSIDVLYEGQLHCHATHGPSGCTLTTDAPPTTLAATAVAAPVDNKGRGESFSPTDLLATALASCMATIMGIQADTLGLDITGMKIHVEKIMATDSPRRIAKLPVTITMPIPRDDKTAIVMERAAGHCPVHHSIHPDIEVPVEWVWGA